MSYKLSPSALNLFRECPRCFWLKQHDVWTRPSGPMSTLPAGMDRALKAYFDQERDAGRLPSVLQPLKQSRPDLRLYGKDPAEQAKLKDWRNNRRGLQWTDPQGNLLIGAIDHALVHCDTTIVVDFKTRGYPPKEDKPESYSAQLNTYGFLFEKNGFTVEESGYLIYYWPDRLAADTSVVFNVELAAVHIDTASALKTFQDALHLLAGPCPVGTCDWCRAGPANP